MLILFLAFLTLFLAVFSLCLIASDKLQQEKDLQSLAKRRLQQMEADNEASWVRNKYMIMR